MENPKHHFLTFKSLIIAIICFHPIASAQIRHQVSGGEPSLPIRTGASRIVINEIMADPSPPVGLPDAEWIELHNAGEDPVRLKDWKLTIGTTVRILPDSLIAAGQYVVVCADKMAPEMEKFGKTVVLSTFPAIRNSGNLLTLINASDSVLDIIDYSDSWYGNSSKKNGGWSLERMDPERHCGQPDNWSSSVHPSGGTPGGLNSIYTPNMDLKRPEIGSAVAISTHTIEVVFSEAIDTLGMKNGKNYTLSGGLGYPETITMTDRQSVRLTWGRALQTNLIYILKISELTDPCGNKTLDAGTEVAWIVLQKGEVVINEILFNPYLGGSDFVEIYNRSAKKIPLGKLLLATKDMKGLIKNLVPLTRDRTAILPGGYFACTEDTAGIFAFYKTPCRYCIGQVSSLPAFNNDQGNVLLLSDSLTVLDEFSYSEEMHHPLVYDPKGVSLERINPENPAREPSNWQSASSQAGFATPGTRNSQYLTEPLKRTAVTFEHTSLSPNNDGFHDELVIGYQTRTPGWIVNGRIFDLSGREILNLLNNVTLSTSGKFRWNGKNENGENLPLGPYIVFIEMFDLSGNIERFRKAVFLTERGE